MAQENRIPIVRGPAKRTIKAALFGWTADGSPKATFQLADGRKIKVTITTVEAESGGGEKWILRGFVILDGSRQGRFYTYYDTGERTGFINFM